MALICHCEVVRERTIVTSIERGAHTVEQLRADCGVARQCGGCEPAVRELLERHASELRHERVPAVDITLAVSA